MPRTPRNPGSGKPPCNGPATGDGLYGPAQGAGAGGPARNPKKATKKDGSPNPAAPLPEERKFSAENQPAPLTDEQRAQRREIAADKEARINQLNDNLMDLALNGKFEQTRTAATIAALNRLAGMPTQRSEISGQGGGPIETIRRVIVDPKAAPTDEFGSGDSDT